MIDRIIMRRWGIREYAATFTDMLHFTRGRRSDALDEIWCLQHAPVYTLGLAGKEEHILYRVDIPVIRADRGGQVTYHGPGQLIVYLMLELARYGQTVKSFVYLLEQALIDVCEELGVAAGRRKGAPGVYVSGKKIASLGIRVKHGCSYHGLALNVNMDLAPFQYINPCGYPGLKITQLSDEGCDISVTEACDALLPHLLGQLGNQANSRVRVRAVTGLSVLPVSGA